MNQDALKLMEEILTCGRTVWIIRSQHGKVRVYAGSRVASETTLRKAISKVHAMVMKEVGK